MAPPTPAVVSAEAAPLKRAWPSQRYRELHDRVPYVRKLPAPAVAIILLVALANAAAWTGCGVALHFHKPLLGTAVLAYTLGLRHALDADHISAIDLTTRRLLAAGQPAPVTVGTWFSLGHSTVVVATSVAVAATAAGLSRRFDTFSRVGAIVGTSVSAAFLLVLGALNAVVLAKAVRRMRALARRSPHAQADARAAGMGARAEGVLHGGGCLTRLFRGAFRVVDRPWKMYPLGILFGLGFDTSSEVALLGIASIQGAQGTSIWLILIFPILFTVGMCLLDTTDGALMAALYSSSAFAHDELAILYYSVVLTAVTVVVAVVIGAIQCLSLVQNVAHPRGKFWHGVAVVGDRFEIVGGAIVGLFAVAAVAAVVAYKPWRRRVEEKRAARGRVIVEAEEDETEELGA